MQGPYGKMVASKWHQLLDSALIWNTNDNLIWVCFKIIVVFISKRIKEIHFPKKKIKIYSGGYWWLLNAFNKKKQIIQVT